MRNVLIAALLLITTQARATSHKPQALRDVFELAAQVESQGQQPVAIFDLDDTLINTRERTLRIINEFISQPPIQAQFPLEVQKLKDLQVSEIRFLMTETLRARNVKSSDFAKQIGAFWASKFFTNELVANDQPNPGAVAYVRRLYMSGVKIVYLTGRDTLGMEAGTAENLKKLGFPLDDRAVLITKPDSRQSDLDFKKAMFPSIAQLGFVVGVFENEPANINAHHDAFPDAVAIFLDTIHSNTSVVPEAGISSVRDFKMSGAN